LRVVENLPVALMFFMTLCGFGLATSGTTQVQATIDPSITLAVLGSISSWTMSVGDNTQDVGGLAVIQRPMAYLCPIG
jgi:hypothetical protein